MTEMSDPTLTRLPFPIAEAFHLLCAQLELGIAVLDGAGRLLYGSPRLEQWLGQPSSRLIGRSFARAGDSPAGELADHQRVLRGERIEKEEPLGGKEQRTFHVVKLPLCNEKGEPHGALHLYRDPTAGPEAFGRRQVRLEALGQHAGGLIHDLNNLLNLIVGPLDLVQQTALSTEQDELIRLALEGAGRADQMIKQCLVYLRLGHSERQLVDVNEQVAEVVRLVHPHIGAAIHSEVRLFPTLPRVLAHPSQLTQMLLNLCLNACDAMPEGGRLRLETEEVVFPPDVSSGKRRSGQFVGIHVADTGQGMPPEVQARIFEPFFTTKSSAQGTGLGLAIVADVVEQHGGWIECASMVGLGTRFSIYLPAAELLWGPASNQAEARPEPRPRSAPEQASGARGKEPHASLAAVQVRWKEETVPGQ